MHIVSITWAKEDNESPYNRIHDAIFAIGQNTLGTDGQVRVNGGALAQQGFTLIGPVRDDVLGGRWVTKTFFQRSKGVQPCDLTAYEVRLPNNNDKSAQDFQSSILTVLREINKDDSVDAVVVAGSLIVDAVCDAIRNRHEHCKDIRECNNRLQSIPLLMLYSFEPITDIDNAFFCWFPITTIARNAFDDIMKDCPHDLAQKSIGILMDDNPESVTASVFVKDAYSVFNGLMTTRGKKVQAIYPESHNSELLNDPEQRKKISLDIHKKLFECDIIFNIGVSPIVLDTLVEYAKNDKSTFIYSCNSILTKTSDLNDLSNSIGHGVRFKFYDFVPDSLSGSLSLNSGNNSFFRFFYEAISIILEKASSSRSSAGSLLEKLRQMRYFTAKNNDIFSFSQTRQLIVPTTPLQYTSDGLKEVGGGGLKKSLVSLDSIADLLRYIDREPISVDTADIEDIEDGKAVSRIQEYAKKIEGQFSPSQVTLFLNDTTGGDNIKTLASCDERVSVIQRRLLKVLVDKCVYEPVQLSHETDTLENNGASQFFAIKHDDVLPLNYWQYAASNNVGDHGSGYHFFVSESYADAWSTRKEMNDSDFLDAGCDAFDPKLFLDIQDVFLKGDREEFWKYCYFIPSVIRGGQGKDVVLGWIVMRTAERLSYFEVKLLLIWADRFFEPIVAKLHEHSIQLANVKSAIGSIMSRNGSHNIGSHVLAALSHNVGTMPDDRVLYQYIQQRMDYTATATTDFPTWAGSAKLVNDLMRRFLSQRHLLDYIASSEGLHAFKFQDPNVSGSARWSQENTIKLHVSRQFNDGRKSVEFITYSDDPIAEKASNAANAKNSVKDSDKFSSDLAVALPGGIVGSHAFFTILENVIRNAAKHGWSKFRGENTNLDIYIDFTADDNGRAVLVDVYDGISNVFATYNDYWMVDKDLLNWFEECRDSLQRLTRDERTQISKFLSGKVAVDSLPGCYKKQYLLLQNRSVEAIEKISPWLVGEASRDGGIGNRLWISHTTDESLKRWYETYKESLLTHLSQPEQECIAEFLSGKCSVAKLPVFYQEQYACLLKYNENELKRIAGRLIGDVPIDGSLGNRLWMPLHHCQQIRIEKPFIDETGVLRRENWGLAEMKISAGYLNKRSISDIGGISKGIPIITPICANEDHLGYRFTIPRPRDVAFVCDTTGIRKDKIKGLQTLGVFVVPPPKDDLFVKPKNEGEEDWNYSFVVLPQFPQQADPHLPFRVLAKDNSSKVDMVPSASGFYDEVLKDLRNGTVTAEAVARKLKVKVINAWITYWGETRRKFDFGLPEVRLLTTEVGSSGNAGQGLVSNVDVWNFVFKEMFRSIVGNLLKDGELRPNIIADEVYWYLALIVAMPKTLDSNGAVFDFTGENEVLRKKINDGNAEADYPERELIFNVLDGWFSVLQGILRDTPDGLLQGFAAFAEKYKLRRMAAVDNKKGLEAVYAIALKYHAKVSEALGNNASDFKIRQGNPLYQGNAVNKSNGMPMFVKDLCSAYRESDVMLRKYEERIITLPCCFGEDLNDEIKGNSGGEGVDGVDNKIVQELGISLVYNEKDAEWNEGKSIAFMRHATSDDFNQDKMLYLEPLSGTQSYLNDMMMLGQNESVYQRLTNYHLIAKMYETGLSRILIVDERVSKFLRNRPDEIKTFCRMGIWCVDETKFGEEKIGLDSLITLDKGRFDAFLRYAIVNGSSATNCEELPLRDRRFDILIIHQGLIDKWLPHVGTGCGKVESFIKRLKEFVPYVVITTGRGTPANIPDSARILPFSVVETALFKKYPEKMVLVDTIMNILPIGEHK